MSSEIAAFENEIKEYKLQVSTLHVLNFTFANLIIVGDSPTGTPSRSGQRRASGIKD